MQTCSGGCYCGNIRFDLTLSQAAEHYRPRACDCDFCRKHGAAYVSDPVGSLQLQVRDGSLLQKVRQGAELADFLLCGECGVLVAVQYSTADQDFAAINVRAVDTSMAWGATQPASPKPLSPEEKMARWQALWFGRVTLAIAE